MRITVFLLGLVCWLSASAGVSVWVPFDSDGGHISIPVTLNGVETRAILDSGAALNGISERFLSDHEGEYSVSQEMIVSGVHGSRRVRQVDGIDISMFGASFKIDRLVPLRIYSADLVVGLAFFQNFILQIDYPNSRLRIITRDAMDLKDAANVRMKKNGSMSQPMVKVELNDEYKAWLMLDTGNSTGIFMPRKPAIRYGWLEEFGTTDVQIRGVNKVSASQSFNLPKMTIGPFTMENVIAMVPAEGNETNVGRESTTRTGSRIKKDYSDGILGYDVLKHFVVTIDYKRALLHLAPPADE
jgi:hypothetical protein